VPITTVIWLSSKRRRFTVMVTVRDGIVVKAAPIVRVFLGQPIENLLIWALPDQIATLAEENDHA
jgi:hypothetical protein